MFDYVDGKQDWLSYNLPREGHAVLASDALGEPAATCRLDESIGELRERALAAGARPVIVVNAQEIVMGRLGKRALEGAADALAGELLTEGPPTVRPNEDLEALVRRMERARVVEIIVTSPDGRLFGTLRRGAAEQLLGRGRSEPSAG